MHVLQVTDVVPPDIGGVETALKDLLVRLQDIRFTILTPKAPPQGMFGDHVEVRSLSVQDAMTGLLADVVPASFRPRARLLTHPLYEWMRRRIASRAQVDLVHMHTFSVFRYFANFAVNHPGRLSRAVVDWLRDFRTFGHPLVFTDHSLFGGRPEQFLSIHADLLVERLEYVVCVERSGVRNVEAVAQRQGLSTKAWWIPNPIDTERFSPVTLPPTRCLEVGYAGRLGKGDFGRILDAIDESPEWVHFRLCLAGSEVEKVKAKDSLSEFSNVTLAWNVPYVDMPRFYNSVHVLLTAWPFGVPRTVLEALACGRMAVQWGGSPVADDLPPMMRTVQSDRPEALYAELETLRDSPTLERLGEEARTFAINTYAAYKVANQYRELYRLVVSAAPRQPAAVQARA